MKTGPNVKSLMIRRMVQLGVPPGGGLPDALEFISDPEKLTQAARDALVWVQDVFRVVRSAAGPNPFRNASDEEIAGEILSRIPDKFEPKK